MEEIKKGLNLHEVVKPNETISSEEEKQSLYSSIQNFVDVQGTDEALDAQNERFNLTEYRQHNKRNTNPMIGEVKEHEVTFPRAFYSGLYRLLGIPDTEENHRNRPPKIGIITNEIIYQRFPPGTLRELQRLNPKTEDGYRLHKHFQRLSDIGTAHLKQFIDDAVTLMPKCQTYDEFYQRLRRDTGRSFQLPLFGELPL